MKILVMAGKGGGGKTTTAINIAAVARKGGLGVGILDADPQRSLSDWRIARGNAAIPVQACRVEELLEKCALARASRFGLLIIDMPSGIGAHTITAIGLADFVILPMRPTALDFRATRPWVNLLRSAAQPCGVVINAAPPRREGIDAPAVRAARLDLQSLSAPLWPGQITHRQSIPQSAISGRGVAEVDPAERAAIEYAGLWTSILRRIETIGSTHHEKSLSHVA
jgi:chromosome partitioning protein